MHTIKTSPAIFDEDRTTSAPARCVSGSKLYNAVWEMSTPTSIIQPNRAGRSHMILKKALSRPNVDEGAHSALHNKICIKISMLRSIMWVQKWSGLNGIVDHQPLRQMTETALGPRFAVLFSENMFYEYH